MKRPQKKSGLEDKKDKDPAHMEEERKRFLEDLEKNAEIVRDILKNP